MLDGPLLGRCIFSDEQRAPPSRIICNEGYTGVNCQECAEGYTPYEGGCTRYPDTYCSVAGSIGLNADQTCECKVCFSYGAVIVLPEDSPHIDELDKNPRVFGRECRLCVCRC